MVHGEEHPGTLQNIGNLATIIAHQGKSKEAADTLMKVAELEKRVLGSEHTSTLRNTHNIAITLWGQGQLKEAQDILIKIVEGRLEDAVELLRDYTHRSEKVFGIENIHTKSALSKLPQWRVQRQKY
ncbi:uncharacterized protein LY79DRAFT_581330 [Colletotrichum navitas]|uniref:Kinesin light chain n=1 Tax=Colletotrichum navitas TaxID=681940 RepID=A0AAD8PVW7_9PEZI|nr:uncharacterized protein LY79DRAFT_581330 [Colletotrichum navitas]KAK1585045.1 hypothetical protein LY79DRAFT_581330 [Colletotrichum navitas]